MTDALELGGVRAVDWKDALPDGAEPEQVHFGRDASGVGEVQIAVATVTGRPTKADLAAMWKTRGAKTAMPVVVAAVGADGVWMFSGGTSAMPLGPLPHAQAQLRLQSILDEPDGIRASQRIRAIEQAYETIGAAGFSNHFLFASYHLQKDVPRRSDWARNAERAASIQQKRGRDLIAALGFTSEDAVGGALVLRSTNGSRRAIAVLLNESEQFDQKSPHYPISPVAHGLELAKREDVQWVIVMRQSTLRLYPGRDGVGVGQRGQSETYFELDLAFLDEEFVALLTLVFSADALEVGGSADEILAGSARYAADLGSRLRDRVYLGVVPRLSIAVAERLPQLGVTVDAEGLQVAYRLSMRILFRLLFQAYGEATELLPADRNEHYDATSLRKFVEVDSRTDPQDFSEEASSIWIGLNRVWNSIFVGNSLWGVPAYGGSLFDPASDEGLLLERLQLPDSVLGPALQAMLTEKTDEGWPGAVDFRSLQVREFGTIYEGLLESSLSLAETDLTTDKNGVYIPAPDGVDPEVQAGEPYFHSASGERKATGSYYTPKIVVDHLIERSVEPALDAHLGRVKALLDEGREREAGDLFFDFRVADLAMGSAHFLVAAVDKIERGMRDFLTATPVPSVIAELGRLEEKAKTALGVDTEAAEAIKKSQLLRRQVARRCIYGLDINPLAVELSRLALWIHTFVPGLPMSSLDHGLVLANSLTGIGTVDEAMDALNVGPVHEPLIREPLALAHELLKDYARASEADKSEVAAGAELLARAQNAAAPAKAIFDVAVAKRLAVSTGDAWDAEQFAVLSEDRGVREAVDPLQPAHMPYLFPEVFLRERPGFDVLIGNPPWEELVYEEIKYWTIRFPGLKGNPPALQKALVESYRDSRPDLVSQMEKEKAAANGLRAVLATGPFPGLERGHADLYKAFSWRFVHLARSGGRFSVVLPRTAVSALGSSEWRQTIQQTGHFEEVVTLLNTAGWVFPSVDGRYSVALVTVQTASEGETAIAGPYASPTAFRSVAEDAKALRVSSRAVSSWTGSVAFPQLPSPSSLPVFLALRQAPNVVGNRDDLKFAPVQGDFNQTTDSGLFDIGAPSGEVPVLKGASFDLWNPDFGAVHGYAELEVVRSKIEGRLLRQTRTSSSAYFGLDASKMVADHALPMDRARIAFRDITNATNTRTVVVALAPPGVVLINSAPFLVNKSADSKAESFLLGILSSIPLDWYARRYVELHLNFHIFNDLPVPQYRAGDPISDRVVEIAGMLAAVDGRYRSWADDVGVQVGLANSEPTKSDLINELDALVALLYGLSPEQLEHVFSTFHRGWDYTERLAAVLECYDAWKDA